MMRRMRLIWRTQYNPAGNPIEFEHRQDGRQLLGGLEQYGSVVSLGRIGRDEGISGFAGPSEAAWAGVTPISVIPPTPSSSRTLAASANCPLPPAIDQQYVRLDDLAIAHSLVTSRQCLVHGGVIISGLDTADVEAPVVALERPFDTKHNAGRHRVGAACMADVKAFQSIGGFLQIECLAQILQA